MRKFSVFRRKSAKKSVSIFLIALLVVVIGIGIYFYLTSKFASAAWFDDNWAFRQAVTITVSSNASDVTNLATTFTVNTSALISTKMQSSCQDLRFTNAAGKLLPYYLDSGCNTTTTKIWVIADLVPKNTTTYTMYMYYGNPTALAGSTTNYGLNMYQGLIGYWNMNEASWNGTAGEVKDLSGSGDNGVRAGDATTTTGKFGNGGTFDGTGDYTNMSDPANGSLDFPGTGGWTISTWIKTSATGGIIVGKDDNTLGRSYNFFITSNHLGFDYFAGATTFNATGSVSSGTWRHAVVTYQYVGTGTSKIRIYIDGVLDSSTDTADGPIPATSAPFRIASRSYSGAEFALNAQLDETRVYNRALSATEVAQLYNDTTSSILTATQGQAVPTTSFATEEKGTGPVAYWKFDDGTGTNAQDSTVNNADGTLAGTTKPTWQTEDQCVSGKCLFFDGSTSNITVASAINNVMSVSMWVKPITTASTVLIDLDGGTHKITTDASSVLSATGFTSPTYYINGVQKTTPTLVANTWQYITVTTGTGFNSTSSLTIGKTGTTFFKGFLDDVKIYNYARTATQILTDYNSRSSRIGSSAQISSPNQWLSQGLVGYWKMEETASPAVDSSGNGYSGTWYGNTTATAGKFGNGATFDGTGDYIQTSSININFPTITVSTWFKSADVTSTKRILEHDWDNGGVFGFHQQTGHVHAVMYNASHTQMGDIDLGAVSTGTWYHIVQTYDGTTWKGYLNGQPAGTNIVDTSGLYQANKTLYLGARAYQYNGVLDETRMYNRALSPKEVSDLYNWAPGPKVQLNMEEGSGTSANDSSGNANNGTVNSGTWTTGKYGKGVNVNGTSGSNVSVPDFAY